MAFMVVGVLMGVAFLALIFYALFHKLYALNQLFGDISADDIELPEEEKAWQNPLLPQQTDQLKQQNH